MSNCTLETPVSPPRMIVGDGDTTIHGGLNLRDCFAAVAAGGLAAAGVCPTPGSVAQKAYAIAEAMLAERKRLAGFVEQESGSERLAREWDAAMSNRSDDA